MYNFVLDRIENNVGKGDSACYQHFVLFPQCFQEAHSSGSLKLWIVKSPVTFSDSSSFLFFAFEYSPNSHRHLINPFPNKPWL